MYEPHFCLFLPGLDNNFEDVKLERGALRLGLLPDAEWRESKIDHVNEKDKFATLTMEQDQKSMINKKLHNLEISSARVATIDEKLSYR